MFWRDNEGIGKEVSRGSTEPGKWKLQKSERGWSMWNPYWFVNWYLWKLDFYPLPEAGRQGLYLQVLTGTNRKFFWQPSPQSSKLLLVFSTGTLRGSMVMLRMWPWAVRNHVSVLFKSFFFFFGHSTWHVGSQFPNQGSNHAPCSRSLES